MSIHVVGGTEADEANLTREDAVWNAAIEEAARLIEVAADRIGGGRSRINQIDAHTIDLLQNKAVQIRVLKR